MIAFALNPAARARGKHAGGSNTHADWRWRYAAEQNEVDAKENQQEYKGGCL